MNKVITYYYLQRKQDRHIFYVGQTTKPPQQRLYNHIQDAKRKSSAKDLFIRQWADDIEIIPFETVEDRPKFDANYREKYWISTFVKYGHPLLNNTLSWMLQYNFMNYSSNTHIDVSWEYWSLFKEYEKYIW